MPHIYLGSIWSLPFRSWDSLYKLTCFAETFRGAQFLRCCLFICLCFAFFWTTSSHSNLHCSHCHLRKADRNLIFFAHCRLNSRHTVSFQVVVPLTNWLWKTKLGHLNNSCSNSDVISLFSSRDTVLHPLFVITDQRSTRKQEKASGREQHCAGGYQQYRDQTQGLSQATGFALSPLICVLLSLCTCPLK